MQYISVYFKGTSVPKYYTYACNLCGVGLGDELVVQTHDGHSVGTVSGLNKPKPEFKCKWAVQFVDTDTSKDLSKIEA